VAKNFDIKIRATNGEQAAAAIKRFADEAQKAATSIRAANDAAASSSARVSKGLEDTAAAAAKAGSPATTARLGKIGETFDDLEGRTKKFGRTLNDARGTFELLGGAAGSAGQTLTVVASTIGNVADVFGTLSTILGKSPLLVISGILAIATTAFVAFRSKTDEAKTSQEELAKAIAATNGLLLTQAERAAIALEGSRKAAFTQAEAAIPGLEAAAKAAEANLKRLEDAAERQKKAQRDNPGRTFDREDISASARAAAQSAQAKLDEARSTVERLRGQSRTLGDPAAFAQRELLFPGRGATQFRVGGSREDLSEEDAVKALREDAEARNKITGEAIQRESEARQKSAEAARVAREKEEREFEAFEKRQAEMIERTVEANTKKTAEVGKYIDKLEEEAKLTGQTNQEREVGLKLFEAQSKLVDELGNKTRDLTEAEKARISAAVKTKEAYEAQQKAAEKVKQEIDRASARATDRLVDFAGDAIFDRLSGRVTNFWDTFRDYGRRVIAQLAAEMVFRPIIAPIVSAVVAGGASLLGAGASAATQTAAPAGGGLFGGGGIMGSPASSLVSTGGSLLSSAMGGSGGLLQTLGTAVGGALGIGGGSAALGAFSTGAFASTAAATGTAAAAAAGSSLAAGGVLGGAAGSAGALAGTAGAAAAMSPLMATGIGALIAIPALLALSGVFGKKKSVGPFASYAGTLENDGTVSFRAGGEKNGGSMSQMADAARSMADGIKQVASALGIYKLPRLNIGVGSEKGQTFFGTSGSIADAVYKGQDPGVAAAAYVRAALQGALRGQGALATSSKSSELFARTTGDAKTDLEFVAVYEGLDETAAAAGTVSRALDELNAQFDTYAELARKYGLEVERIEKARGEAVEKTVAQLLEPLNSRLGGIRGLVASLTVGPGSPLSAEKQLDAARSQFDDLAARSRKGDVSAQSALGDAGRTYLDTARGFFATTEQYGAIFGSVVGEIGDLLDTFRESDPTVKAIVETGEAGTAAVTKALGTLIEEVQRLRDEVRRGNEIPSRVLA
jgi:hypothetical protein